MGFASQDDLITSITTDGQIDTVVYQKTSPAAGLAGHWQHFIGGVGTIPAATFGGTEATFTATDNTWSEGAIPIGDQTSPVTKHILNMGVSVVAAAGAPWFVLPIDLVGYAKLTTTNVSTTGVKTITMTPISNTTANVDRYPNGEGLRLFVASYATMGANAPTMQVTYTNSAGTTGKTTTSGKLAKRLKEVDRKKVLLASLDVRRPAAQEQLAILGEQVGVASLPIIAGQDPIAITKRAMETARLEGYDVLILDTAGRLSIDEELMAEVVAVRDVAQPHEKLLVVDAMTGQDAVNTAKNFEEKVGVSGIILTRIDGDARGGAALSMRAVTGRPIKFLGTGEKIDALEVYHPDRLAGRILDMGDVVSLVEKAAATIDQEVAEDMARKFISGKGFDFDDLAKQMQQMRKMGGMSSFMGMLPGMGKIKEQIQNANIDEKQVKRTESIIYSMTKAERKDVDLLNASRKRRIAMGAGVEVAEVNRLIKQFLEMQKMMKQLQRLGKGGFLRSMGGMMMGGRK